MKLPKITKKDLRSIIVYMILYFLVLLLLNYLWGIIFKTAFSMDWQSIAIVSVILAPIVHFGSKEAKEAKKIKDELKKHYD